MVAGPAAAASAGGLRPARPAVSLVHLQGHRQAPACPLRAPGLRAAGRRPGRCPGLSRRGRRYRSDPTTGGPGCHDSLRCPCCPSSRIGSCRRAVLDVARARCRRRGRAGPAGHRRVAARRARAGAARPAGGRLRHRLGRRDAARRLHPQLPRPPDRAGAHRVRATPRLPGARPARRLPRVEPLSVPDGYGLVQEASTAPARPSSPSSRRSRARSRRPSASTRAMSTRTRASSPGRSCRSSTAELRAAVAAGAHLVQIDEPAFWILPGGLPEMVDIFNACVEGVEATTSLHLCFGNFRGRPATSYRSLRRLRAVLQRPCATTRSASSSPTVRCGRPSCGRSTAPTRSWSPASSTSRAATSRPPRSSLDRIRTLLRSVPPTSSGSPPTAASARRRAAGRREDARAGGGCPGAARGAGRLTEAALRRRAPRPPPWRWRPTPTAAAAGSGRWRCPS